MELVLAFIAGAGIVALVMLVTGAGRRDEGIAPELDQTLGELRGALSDLAQRHADSAGEVRGALTHMSQVQSQLAQDTTKLSTALAKPGVRGNWGEVTLRNLVEYVGLAHHVDFDTQAHMRGDGDDPAARPDLVLRLPGDGSVPVDAKLPLDAFRDAIGAASAEAREAALDRHVAAVRSKVRELAAKAYWNRFRRAPEIVVMFVASEAAFCAAAERDPEMLEIAARDRVVITTPATMVALLHVVALGWRERDLSENAEQVRGIADELVKRLGVMTRHLAGVGAALDKAARAHNESVASYEGRLLVTARKLGELGIAGTDKLDEPARVETTVRMPAAGTPAPADVVAELENGSRSAEAA